jgi:tetratricopeptide (TPR) repeat protein
MNPKSIRIVPVILAGIMCITGTSCISPKRDEALETRRVVPAVRSDGSESGAASGNEVLRRHGAESYAIRCMDRADSELGANRFDSAAALYRDAVKNLAHHPDDDPLFGRATRGLGETYYRWARALEKARDYEGAMKMARRAAVHGHRAAEKLYRRLDRTRLQR